MFYWLTGYWLPGCLVAWLPGYLVYWLPGWLAGWLAGWVVAWLPGQVQRDASRWARCRADFLSVASAPLCSSTGANPISSIQLLNM